MTELRRCCGSTGAVADSATDSYNVAVNLANGRNASFAVPAGSSAGFAAGEMNKELTIRDSGTQ